MFLTSEFHLLDRQWHAPSASAWRRNLERWMRYLAILSGLLLIPATVHAVPPGIVGWWKADGNANDSAGTNHGTLIPGATYAAGKIGQAFSLNGAGAYVDIGNGPALQVSAGDFTVAAWVNFASIANDMSIVDKMAFHFVPDDDGWRLIKQADNHFWFCFGRGTSPAFAENGCFVGADTTVRSATIATPGVWYHVAGVKSGNSISIYVNGVLESTTNPLGPVIDSNTTPLRIGSFVTFAPAYMNGLIDEVQLYNRALTVAEIQSLTKAPYSFNGFFQPVDKPPTLNLTKAGSAVPIKFSLSGDKGLGIIEQGYPMSQTVSCSTSAPTDVIEQTVSAGGSSLSYDPVSDQYTYVWKTEKNWSGCRELNLRLNDGTDHKALFLFGK